MDVEKRGRAVWLVGAVSLLVWLACVAAAFLAGTDRDNNVYDGIWDALLPWLLGVCVAVSFTWALVCFTTWRAESLRSAQGNS